MNTFNLSKLKLKLFLFLIIIKLVNNIGIRKLVKSIYIRFIFNFKRAILNYNTSVCGLNYLIGFEYLLFVFYYKLI